MHMANRATIPTVRCTISCPSRELAPAYRTPGSNGTEPISTLDLIPLDRFVLLTSDPAWAAEAETLSQKSIPLDVILVGRDLADIDGNWGRVSDLPVAGAVLVRPDQHVAWRAFDASADSIADLGRALQAMIA